MKTNSITITQAVGKNGYVTNTKLGDSEQSGPSIHASLEDAYGAGRRFFDVPAPPFEIVTENGDILREWATPNLPGISAAAHSIIVRTPEEKVELEKIINDPDCIKSDDIPDELPGDGYFWKPRRGTICGTIWVRTKI